MPQPPSSLLEQEAPGLFGSLKRSCSCPEELALLCDSYELSVKHRGKEEVGFTRKEGVSYNPRPARIGAILIKHYPTNSLSAIQRGILACASELPQRYQRSVISILNPSPACSEEELAIAATLCLDDLRHLHLRSDKDEVIEKLKSRAKTMINFMNEHEALKDLYTILSAAVQRYER